MTTATNEPTSLRAGDSTQWTRTFDAYRASAGWVLSYRLIPRSGGNAININASASGESFVVALDTLTTAAWPAGSYSLVGVVTNGNARATVCNRACDVLPDLMTAAALDTRSSARTIVEAIDAWLAGKAGWAGEKQLADRRIKDHPLPELITLRSHYASMLAGEDAANNLASGLGNGRGRIMVRM